MTNVQDSFRHLAAAVTAKIERVTQERCDSPSPCANSNARDLVRHLIETDGMFLGQVGRTLRPGPDVEDPLGAWVSARDQVQADLDDPAQAGEEFDGYSGSTSFADSVDRFVCFDLNVRGWALARATGQDERIDAGELPRWWSTAESFGDALRSQNVRGPAVEVAADAPEPDRLLADLGRRR